MLLKLLLMVLMFGIMWFFLSRKRRGAGGGGDTLPVSRKQLGIGIGLVLAVVAGLIFSLKWQADRKIIVLRVESPTGTVTYEARQKNIRERSFVTLDGLEISLGDDDRLVIIR